MLKALSAYILNYIRLIVFASAVLAGVQIPAFVGQYQLVVNAHLSEAKQNVLGFQATADRYFASDINKLIAHYRQSQDPVFVSDANNIQAIVSRIEMLSAEADFLLQHPMLVVFHVAKRVDSSLFAETLVAYQWTVPLNIQALLWGLGAALIIVLLIDLLSFVIKRLFMKSHSVPISRVA